MQRAVRHGLKHSYPYSTTTTTAASRAHHAYSLAYRQQHARGGGWCAHHNGEVFITTCLNYTTSQYVCK